MKQCPECKREWEEDSEQAKAIELRKMCIVCLTEKGIAFSTDPYEFQKEKKKEQKGESE